MDHYQVLGVPYTATRTEIEDAYRALLSQSNTDKDPTASNTSQEDQDVSKYELTLHCLWKITKFSI